MRIGVLRGGPSTHYELSLRSGGNVIRNLRSKHPVRDVYIDRDGNWHYEGLPIEPARLLPHIDLFWKEAPYRAEFVGNPEIVFIIVTPKWVRVSDFSVTPPKIEEKEF